MKKVLVVLVVMAGILGLTGCEKVNGKYKEGTYFGSVETDSYGAKFVTTAVLYIDKTGTIKSCFIDSTYNKNSVSSTKKTLGDDYGMKTISASSGNIEGGAEWYEQVEVIEKKIIDEQGIDWVKWSNDEQTKLDAVSGVTIAADSYISAVSKALEQAKNS